MLIKSFAGVSCVRNGSGTVARVVLAGVGLALAGCSHDLVDVHAPSFDLVAPAQRHPILVSEKPTTLTVRVPHGSLGLTPKARADVIAFADRSRSTDAGDSRLVIQAPSGSANEIAAMNGVQQIRGLLLDSGYDESAVTVEAVDASAHHDAPITITYMRYVAQGPECGKWPMNVAYEPQNLPMANTGCANQRNLAGMIANPSDLLGPRSQTQRSGERRDVVWEKYQKGQTTASDKNEDGRVSTRQQGN